MLSHLGEGMHHIAGGESVGISYSRGARLAVARSHELIADALEARDADAARALWRSHLMEAARSTGAGDSPTMRLSPSAATLETRTSIVDIVCSQRGSGS